MLKVFIRVERWVLKNGLADSRPNLANIPNIYGKHPIESAPGRGNFLHRSAEAG
jgi:hypothetical protein